MALKILWNKKGKKYAIRQRLKKKVSGKKSTYRICFLEEVTNCIKTVFSLLQGKKKIMPAAVFSMT